MSADRTLRRWRQRARAAYHASPAYRAAQRRLRRRKLHYPSYYTPHEVEIMRQAYCAAQGRYLGGRPPAVRRCTKRLPPGRGRQCWGWRTKDADRCWRHQRAPAA